MTDGLFFFQKPELLQYIKGGKPMKCKITFFFIPLLLLLSGCEVEGGMGNIPGLKGEDAITGQGADKIRIDEISGNGSSPDIFKDGIIIKGEGFGNKGTEVILIRLDREDSYTLEIGEAGNQGPAGEGINSLILIIDEPAGDNCANGGKKLQAGLDNGDAEGISGKVKFTPLGCNMVN